MPIFTVKRHLLFLKIACGWFVFYNALAILTLFNDSRGFPDEWIKVGSFVGIILRLAIYANTHFGIIFASAVVHLAGIVAAIYTLALKEHGRTWMIRLFYLAIIAQLVKLLTETVAVYCLYTATHWKECKIGDMMLYVFILHQAIYTAPIFVAILFWLTKQFKSHPIKNLFQQKSVPEIPETL